MTAFQILKKCAEDIEGLNDRLVEEVESLKRRNEARMDSTYSAINEALLSLREAEIEMTKARQAESARRKPKHRKDSPDADTTAPD